MALLMTEFNLAISLLNLLFTIMITTILVFRTILWRISIQNYFGVNLASDVIVNQLIVYTLSSFISFTT